MKNPAGQTLFFALFFLCFLSGCGYRCAPSSFQSEPTTISIPFVEGDAEGLLTNALIKELSASGHFQYVREEGSLILGVTIKNEGNEKIGYAFDRKSTTGDLKKNLVGTEGRRMVSVEVTLKEAGSDEPLISPMVVQASEDYDYVGAHSVRDLSFINSHGVRESVLRFSLGQLDSIEGAQDDSAEPLYRLLAQKITDGILNTF